MKSVEKLLGYLVGLLLAGALFYGIWQIQRKINFTFSYEDQVRQVMEKEMTPQIEALRQKVHELESRLKALEDVRKN